MNVTGAARMLGLESVRLTDRDLSAAWRRFAREHHPDRRPGDPTASQRFIAGREAYEVLRDRLEQERQAGWHQAQEQFRRMGRVLSGDQAGAANPYRFTSFAAREWRA